MELSVLDQSIQLYCRQGVADSSHRTYQAAYRAYVRFCLDYGVLEHFPINEHLLCCFVCHLAARGLAASSIKTYLAGVRFEQIARGFPNPPMTLSMARLKLAQAGVVRSQAGRQSRVRLPITPDILLALRQT